MFCITSWKLETLQPAYFTRCLPQVNRCLSIKGAEDAINKPYAFEISTTDSNMYFVADKDKVQNTTATTWRHIW